MAQSGDSRALGPRSVRQCIHLRSDEHVQVFDITKLVRDTLVSADVSEGVVVVNSMHTTCALLVNEYQASLIDDLKAMLEGLAPERAGYRHDDPRCSDCERGNGAAHLRASVLGRSAAIGISGGELSLGRFQSILFAEFDGPRPRDVDVQILGF